MIFADQPFYFGLASHPPEYAKSLGIRGKAR
jgi:hypothetical protein